MIIGRTFSVKSCDDALHSTVPAVFFQIKMLWTQDGKKTEDCFTKLDVKALSAFMSKTLLLAIIGSHLVCIWTMCLYYLWQFLCLSLKILFFVRKKKKLLGEEDEKYKTLRQRDHLPLWVHVIADWHTSKPFTGIAWTLAKMFFILCLFYMLERQFEVITFYCELLYLQQI